MKLLGDYRRPVSDTQDSWIKCHGVNLKIQNYRTEAEIMSDISVLGWPRGFGGPGAASRWPEYGDSGAGMPV